VIRRREFITLLGGAAVWPLPARAEQSAIPIVGFLSTNQSAAVPHFTAAFREGLAEAGFIDGKNVAIEFRFAEQRLERVPALAMDLVRRQVAVIFTAGGDVPAMVAKGATSTIPIVFVTGFDPNPTSAGCGREASAYRTQSKEAIIQTHRGLAGRPEKPEYSPSSEFNWESQFLCPKTINTA
jgi:ABC transporter substrate binding protein